MSVVPALVQAFGHRVHSDVAERSMLVHVNSVSETSHATAVNVLLFAGYVLDEAGRDVHVGKRRRGEPLVLVTVGDRDVRPGRRLQAGGLCLRIELYLVGADQAVDLKVRLYFWILSIVACHCDTPNGKYSSISIVPPLRPAATLVHMPMARQKL